MRENQERKKLTVGVDMAIIFSSFLGIFLVLAFIKIFQKVWWIPTRIQNQMASQGIGGPSYKLVQGNAKKMWEMRKESMSSPMTLSHNIFPKVQPHLESWANMYGKLELFHFVGTDHSKRICIVAHHRGLNL